MPRTKIKRILELLLDLDYFPKSKYEIAKKVNCTPSWVIMAFKNLEEKKLVKGLKVINIKGLFNLFHKIRPKKLEYKAYSVYSLKEKDLLQFFSKIKKDYAFTTYLAENVLQKYLFASRTDLYVKKDDLKEWHEELTKIGTYGGGNIRLIVSEYDELFNKKQEIKNKTNKVWIVNIPQLISDLLIEGGPAKEAGEMLLKKLIKKNEEN